MFSDYLYYLQTELPLEIISRILLFFLAAVIFDSTRLVLGKQFATSKIQQTSHNPQKTRHDTMWTILNRVILAGVTVTLGCLVLSGQSLIYTSIEGVEG